MNPLVFRFNLFLDTEETRRVYDKMLEEWPHDDPAPLEEIHRSIKKIYESIERLSAHWVGDRDARIPNMPMNRREYWGYHAVKIEPEEPHIPLLFIKEPIINQKLAIDLGCGCSQLSNLLLQKGWRVIAVDNSKIALEFLAARNRQYIESGQLKIVEADITEYIPEEPAHLVLALHVLPYIDPRKFQVTWEKIYSFIIEKGVFIGSLFQNLPDFDRKVINSKKEEGAWFLPNQEMAELLLKHMNYTLLALGHRNNSPWRFEFIVQKKLPAVIALN